MQQDPLFVDADGADNTPGTEDDDLHLGIGSPCFETGNDAALPPDIADLDGDDDTAEPTPLDLDDKVRLRYSSVDMGVYEYILSTLIVVDDDGPAHFASIQAALDSAISGVHDIKVQPGTYYEAINFNGKEIHLYSSGGPEVTTIDGTGYAHVVQCVNDEGFDTKLEGFTITGGSGSWKGGGGMYNDYSTPWVTNCIFRGNQAGYGGGMYNYYAHPFVFNCIFTDNSAGHGGGIFNDNSGAMVLCCAFIGNSATHGGGAHSSSSQVASTLFINCTFSDNSADDYGGMKISGGYVKNCIFWNNSGGELYGSGFVTYSDVKGGYPGEGNINVDPLFVDAANGNYRLGVCSRCIDAGTNSVSPWILAIPPDLDGNPRYVDDAGVIDTGFGSSPIVDMGAYERQEDSVGWGTIFVDDDGPADFDTIQAAIDAAGTDDEIIVAKGTYPETIDFKGKIVTVHSTDINDPNVVAATIIDATGLSSSVIRFVNGEGPEVVLGGFTITGGNAIDGGGLYIDKSDPTVTHCV
ncbi:MAG: hypothetical protein GY869_19890, partial [Planctomycetes bacterium]|nr:hypothetical protein [Planctomycetota bacterium]